MKLRGQDSDGFGCEEEVSTGSNTTDAAVVGNSPAMTSNVPSLPSVQKVLHSPDSTTTNQSADIESAMRNKYTEPELMGDFGLRYLGDNGEYLMRTGRLPTPGLPPASESEASSTSSSPALAVGVVEKAVATVHPKPKPKMKMQKASRPRPCLKMMARPRLQVRPRVHPRPQGCLATMGDKAAMLAQALRGIKATQAARAAKKDQHMDMDRNAKKIRREARKTREEQFVRDLLALHEEMKKTDAELSRLITEGREKMAAVQERRRLREADRQKKRAKLASFFHRE